jgi:agmatine deiminase
VVVIVSNNSFGYSGKLQSAIMFPLNTLWLADTLPQFYPTFFHRFNNTLMQHGIDMQLLPGTKDVWARDYMPVATASGALVKFRYFPTYLRKRAADRATISDVHAICQAIDIHPAITDIILDGGNLLICGRKAMLTERVFVDNPDFSPEALRIEISRLLEVEELILLPEWPGDFTGHADGMVRFVDEKTVLVNDYSQESEAFRRAMSATFDRHELKTISMPYNPYRNRSAQDATGVYVNYLRIQDQIFFPVFGLKEDEIALSIIQEAFPSCQIIPIQATEIARSGGLLNCISWNY